jgi:hypothetical protein
MRVGNVDGRLVVVSSEGASQLQAFDSGQV